MTEMCEDHKLEEIEVGQKRKFSVKITESLVNKFAKISGDYNPLHVDEQYAKSTKFGKRVCHGMLLGSFFSKMVGMHLPGKNALYFSQTLNFKLPCFINDEVTVEGEVFEKSLASRMLTIKTTIYNQEGKCLVDGIAKVMVR
ncbi:MAG: MaoC family dehydratase [Thaumarchaeota archaeon]|nr:MaoC family dehydratase [Nitrososphaerota archaeon]